MLSQSKRLLALKSDDLFSWHENSEHLFQGINSIVCLARRAFPRDCSSACPRFKKRRIANSGRNDDSASIVARGFGSVSDNVPSRHIQVRQNLFDRSINVRSNLRCSGELIMVLWVYTNFQTNYRCF